jgi:hypothetical protein
VRREKRASALRVVDVNAGFAGGKYTKQRLADLKDD